MQSSPDVVENGKLRILTDEAVFELNDRTAPLPSAEHSELLELFRQAVAARGYDPEQVDWSDIRIVCMRDYTDDRSLFTDTYEGAERRHCPTDSMPSIFAPIVPGQ